MWDQRVLLKTRPNSAHSTSGDSSHLSTCRDPMDIDNSISTLLYRERWCRDLTTRVQKNKVDQWDRIRIRVTENNSAGPPCQRQHREHSNKEVKENWDETQGKQPPQHRYFHNFNYWHICWENPKQQSGKETKAADPPAKNSFAPTPQLPTRAGLSKYCFTNSLPSSGLVIQ